MNSFGKIFRVSIFGESHGQVVGVTIDGCPAGIAVDIDKISEQLERRRSGKKGTTPRKESDIPEVMSGVFNGYTTGAPLTLITRNSDTRSSDYEESPFVPRPGHADFTGRIKYSGFSDFRGGGHFSGRLTWGLVVAGYFARKIISPATVSARLISAGGNNDIEEALSIAEGRMETIGGIVECRIDGLPVGLGEPFFMSAESVLSSIIFSIPAIRGVEFGTGFAAASMFGSEHNDAYIDSAGATETNHSGGINGGITNGNQIVFRIAVKPASSTGVEQNTIDLRSNKRTTIRVKGRHDTLIALRVPVILESAAAIAFADLLTIDRGINYISDRYK
jgi:chorismate synthase